MATLHPDEFLAMARGDVPFPDDAPAGGGHRAWTPDAGLMQLRARHTFVKGLGRGEGVKYKAKGLTLACIGSVPTV